MIFGRAPRFPAGVRRGRSCGRRTFAGRPGLFQALFKRGHHIDDRGTRRHPDRGDFPALLLSLEKRLETLFEFVVILAQIEMFRQILD